MTIGGNVNVEKLLRNTHDHQAILKQRNISNKDRPSVLSDNTHYEDFKHPN